MEPTNPRIIPINIEDEMKSSYIDYSMSVIVSRALPDVRDGLKPVHRRVLYGMSELGLSASASYKKSARIVGEVLGKYHPHGDSAVYDTMVRLAQDFSMRYPLVDGQGNFGSVDGDSAAAMRYTEARMTKLAEELLRDIDKETVDYQENFDGSMTEPTVLPAAFPNLLVNGGDGIAVGMATKIPPHNLGEVIDATIATIDNPDIEIKELIEHIPGPDFPTGGIIYGHGGVQQAYLTGRGRVVMRAKMHEEEIRPGRLALVVTEIPYQVNKSTEIERIAERVRQERIEGISDLRDESDRDGMRIVIELKRDALPLVVKNQIYKYSRLQQTFGVNMVALVDGRPRVINLKDALRHYIAHRHEVVIRRTEYLLRKAEERAHILEGLTIALDHLDAVISIIRNSDDTDAARQNLMAGVFPPSLTPEQRERLGLPAGDDALFSLSEAQADAILALRLSRLTGLERDKIESEYRDVIQEIERLSSILDSEPLRMEIIKEELLEIKDKFADERRTEIDYSGGGDIIIEDLIEDEQVVVTVSHQGLIKRTPVSEYRQQGRGGVGMRGGGLRDDDFLEHLFVSRNHDYLLFFTDHGQCYWLRVFEIPEGSRTAKGRSIRNLIQIAPDDRIRAVINVRKEQFEDEAFLNTHYIVMATRHGLVKKTVLEAFSRPRVDGIIAIDVVEGDQLLEAHLTDGNTHVMMASSGGRAIRFHEDVDQGGVRAMGRNTRGVRGINLDEGEHVVGMVVIGDEEDKCILSVSANGYGKRTPLNEDSSDRSYSVQNRGGKGVITMKTTRRTGPLVAIKGVENEDDLMIVTENGIMIRTHVDGISTMGRNTQGVRVINLKKGDAIADVTRVIREDDEEETETDAEATAEALPENGEATAETAEDAADDAA
ncbi:MAG: DNA gyrase subunit A [Bacteroidetes bacterium]|jgi:DNA gyrase subunit A|nr:DNA gyrase subunit A [Bacteroidota bacterium]